MSDDRLNDDDDGWGQSMLHWMMMDWMMARDDRLNDDELIDDEKL